MVHVVDPKLCHQIAMDQQSFPKVPASQDSLFLRFLGKENMVVLNGPQWKKQSLIIRNAFSTSAPIHLFASVSRNAIEVMEAVPADDKKGHTLCWSDLTQRIALDAIGLGVMGYDYDSVRTESPFMIEFSTMMHEFVEPLYLVFPVLERWLPRKKVIARVVNFEKRLNGLLEMKRAEPGEDIITKLATHPELSSTEVKDNMATLFFAGHDTSSSAMASVVYYLAVNKDAQNIARAEALRAFGRDSDPSLSSLGPQTLPYIHACIKEALRLNPPASFASPRISHQIATVWDEPHIFTPERFMGDSEVYQQNVKDIDPCMPFLVGPRHCPARDFALYELRTVLVMLLREYDWSLPAGSIHSKEIQNALSPFNTSMPRQLDITFTRHA
ncbi:cytochrome P450 [Coniophora puteana RWD-64-598 SS2]|uniref:Cytochrome P450 n=1 Tax=Coniophora puteana (strain RWD-64-598) TaxID=741705 RepID=A0A5M3N0B1_CONPW|nr:cytochrome P450 [Coniophora puteana RWD-64-598 SS2]EIW84345.1 cytochrome P450 [Coniophora puteana RWD-64-598 SS2]